MAAKITLSMIVKNEEQYLRDCLASVKEIADEIVIVDTGSTDSTISIAEEFGAKIYRIEWQNDFSAARNYALSKSSGDWILYLDADERLSKESLTELVKLTGLDELAGYKCIVKSLDDTGRRPHYMKYVRLFKNTGGIRFKGAVHEQIENSLIENGYKIIDSGIEIIHLGYNVDGEEIEKKARRNLNLLKKEYENDPSAYHAFQLGNTYSVLKEYKSARDYYLKSVAQNNLKSEFKAYAYLNLSDYELRNHHLEKALEFVLSGLNENTESVLLNSLASDIYFRLNKTEDAINFCGKALSINRKIIAGLYNYELAVGLNSEAIISKGVFYSLVAGNKKSLESFLNELQKENKLLGKIIISLLENKPIHDLKKEDVCGLVSEDNIDMFLAVVEGYIDKKYSVEILKSLGNHLNGYSKFHRTLGALLSEINLYDEAIDELRKSLNLEEKDPSALLLLISILIRINRLDELPDLILFAEKEFGQIPEFASKFEILKEKLGAFFT